MADLPSHPAGDDTRSGPVRNPSRVRAAVWVALAGMALVALVVLHLTGVLGAEAHS